MKSVRTAGLFFIITFLSSIILAGCGGGRTDNADDEQQITQNGITWTFSIETISGQFATGDYWVVGPVEIIDISPNSEVITENWTSPNLGVIQRTINGSMINPDPDNEETQGYDSHMYRYNQDWGADYDPEMNKGRPSNSDISDSNPLIVQPNSSLISTISHTYDELVTLQTRVFIKSAAILTVLSEAPPENSFRPPYCGTDKTVKWQIEDLNYSILANLAPVDYTPNIEDIENNFDRFWLEQSRVWTVGAMHPAENMQFYGRDMASEIGDAALMLNLNFSNKEKQFLFSRMVQLGIDFTGFIDDGGFFPHDGGIHMGRKLPILIAGNALNDAHMMDVGNWTINEEQWNGGFITLPFQEDSQTFYVTAEDVAIDHLGRDGNAEEYTADDIGMPEWGIRHQAYPKGDDRRLDAAYRLTNARPMASHALAAHIMGLKEEWNHDAFFDYEDRWWNIDYTPENDFTHQGGAYTNFARSMWLNYRDDYPPVWSE